jgi:hypothetical protein
MQLKFATVLRSARWASQAKKGHPQPGPVRVRTGLRVHYGFALGAPPNPYLLDYAHVSRPCGSGFVQFLVTPS